MKTTTMRLMRTVSIAACLASTALFTSTLARAQVTMAPPVQAAAAPADFDPAAPASKTVFNWSEVPVGRHVTIVRAVFDQTGYQLFADTGETIVVPFVNNNLYVMKFSRTSDAMYFVNDGTAPTLYVPDGGYLTNSASAGSKWYPFSENYADTTPVYEGPAPSWDAYCDMGWYPGMVVYGGYWGYTPWYFGASFWPMTGLYFNIFGHPYYGWGAYHGYFEGHPYERTIVGPIHGGVLAGGGYHGDRGAVSERAARAFSETRSAGTGAARGFGGTVSAGYASSRGFAGATRSFGTGGNIGTRTFGDGSARGFSGGSGRSFSGGATRSVGGSFSGGSRSFSGSFSGGSRSFGGGGFSGGGHSFSAGGGGSHASFGGGGGGGRR